VAALAKSGADCVGGPISSVGRGLWGRAIALAMSSPFGVGNASFRYSTIDQWTDTVAFGAYRREAFDRAGLYDETIDRGEDDELNFRLLDTGGRIFLTPAIKVTYFTRSTLPGLWRQYFGYGRAKMQVLRLHPSRSRPRQFVPLCFVGSLAALGVAGGISSKARTGAWALLATYGLAAFAAAARPLGTRIRDGEGRGSPNSLLMAPLLLVAFPVMHIAYGLGSIAGLIRLLPGSRK
jgi:GT2 family glycosyltransferase